MREILFRGKKQNGEWLQGDLVHYGDKILIFSENAQNSPDYYEVNPETVGQFTGLTDKNGVKIFDGDILKVGENLLAQITFIDENVQDYGDEIHSAFHAFIQKHNKTRPIDSYFLNNCKIIGNIHDNPELLK